MCFRGGGGDIILKGREEGPCGVNKGFFAIPFDHSCELTCGSKWVHGAWIWGECYKHCFVQMYGLGRAFCWSTIVY